MDCHRLVRVGMLFFVVLSATSTGDANGQEVILASRGPRFLFAPTPTAPPKPLEVRSTPVLRQQIALDLDGATLSDALSEITRQTGLAFVFSREIVNSGTRVHLRAEQITVTAALTEILLDAGVDVLLSSPAQAALVRKTEVVVRQPGSVSGRVTDEKSQTAIAGATVVIERTALSATTDNDGRYRIAEVEPGTYTVRARYIGYAPGTQSVTVRAGSEATADFALEVQPTQLNELVTTVTGDQRRLELGHVVATINADSLLQLAPVMSFSDLIQGRSPGVLSMTTSSKSGQAGTIRIRGLNSFSVQNDPIVIVDGVRVEATSGTSNFSATFSRGNLPPTGGYSGRLSDLDPSEIASVEVVKGPSAATLYGTDAANGVLVITTKRGQPGRARWTAFTEQGVVSQSLDQWEEPYYAFGRSTVDGTPQRCMLLARAAGSCVLDSLVSFNTFTHPDTRPYQSGYRQEYGLQVSGGLPNGTTYFFGGNYEQETGTQHMPPSDQAYLLTQRGGAALPEWQLRPNAYEKVNLRANFTAPLGRRADVTLTTGFVSNQVRQGAGGISVFQIGFRDVNEGWLDITQRPAYKYATRGDDAVRRFLGSLALNYKAWDWLTLRGTLGADLSTNAFGSLLRRGEGVPGDTDGFRSANQLDITRYSLDLGATATRVVSPTLTSKTNIGVQYNRRHQRSSVLSGSRLPLGGETVAGAGFLGGEERTISTAVAGGYLEEVLGVRDRLYFTGALRLDGGSAFGKDFSAAVYPKASVSWVITDGNGGPRLPGVSSLRVRAAFGVSGVQPAPTAAIQQVTPFSGLSDGTPVSGAALGPFGNPDLKPERTNEFEGGIDLELASGRVRLELTGYQRTTHDALIQRTLAPDAGGDTRWENLGSVRNRGLELVLGADVLQGRQLSAGITLTGSINQNRLLALGEGVVVSGAEEQGTRQDVGYPLYGWWGRKLESFSDANGNGIIEQDEITLTENQFIGPGFPTREATLAPSVGLFGEQLRLTGLFQYRGGFYSANFTTDAVGCLIALSCRAGNDITTPLADQARTVAMTSFSAFGPIIEPSSYLLLRELSAGLTLPSRLARLAGASDARLVLTARNVALLWRQGKMATTPESSDISQDRITPGIGGPPSYWLVRFTLNY